MTSPSPDRHESPPPPATDETRARIRLSRSFAIWLGVTGTLSFVGWYKTINLLLLLGYVFLLLLLLNLWFARAMLFRVRIQRIPTPPVFPGEVAAVRFEATNPTTRAANLLLTDVAGGQREGWLLAPLDPGQTRRLTARWTFPHRGRHAIGPMLADSSYPFGVVRMSQEIVADGHVLVLPALGEVDLEMFRRWLVRGGAADTNQRKPTRQQSSGQGDVRGLRPYRPGDSPKDVHWKSTARRGQLLVREYDQPEPLDLILVVDPWLPESPTSEMRDRLEWSLSLAMTLGEAWCRLSTSAMVTLAIPGTPPRVESGRATPAFVRRAFVGLAELSGMSQVPPVNAPEIRRRSGRSARLVVSSRPASPLAESLRFGGMSFRTVDPSVKPAWYRPPGSASG